MATYKVEADGKAAKGYKVGDKVVTGGGTYNITGVNPDGTYTSTLFSKDMTTSNTPSSAYTINAAPKASPQVSNNVSYISNAYNQAKAALDPVYLDQTKASEVQRAMALRRQHEASAYSGDRGGLGQQALLSIGNAADSRVSSIESAKKTAKQQLDAERLQAIANERARQDSVNQETYQFNASMDYKKQADALQTAKEQEATTYTRQLRQAETMAQYGDFSGYKALGYSDAWTANAKSQWQADKIAAAKKAAGTPKEPKPYELGEMGRYIYGIYAENPDYDIDTAVKNAIQNGLMTAKDGQAVLTMAGKFNFGSTIPQPTTLRDSWESRAPTVTNATSYLNDLFSRYGDTQAFYNAAEKALSNGTITNELYRQWLNSIT